ncbi:MAG: tRNA lysidine(34) synthetase TilS [Lachnospiraceae bacterium]|nr:tRNA lysidine(34) synthetase TilS [Lachnospiraceae bacterium]
MATENRLLSKVDAYIKKHNMLNPKETIVVGVSGGADSVCLVHVLLALMDQYSCQLIVVHVNHGIRGEEAKEDAQFVCEMMKQLGVRVIVINEDVPKFAKEQGLSVEEAGRMVRYQAFFRVMKENGADKIAVAHNQNDCAETTLFQMFRGSGIRGMSGISPKREEIIRPLLCVSRKEIEAWLEAKNIPYRTDSTNLTTDYTRNKLRLSLLPFAEREINARAGEHIARTADNLREIADYMDEVIAKETAQVVRTIQSETTAEYRIRIADLAKKHIALQKGIVRKVLILLAGKQKDLEEVHVEQCLQLMNRQSGSRVDLPYQIYAEREYEEVVFAKKTDTDLANFPKVPLSKQENTADALTIDLQKHHVWKERLGEDTLLAEVFEKDENFQISHSVYTKCFDYDKIEYSLSLRKRQSGDFLQINREGGTKKIKDYFIDNKIPRKQRDEMLLVADGSHIIWIPGYRISERYKVCENTKRILRLTLEKKENNHG